MEKILISACLLGDKTKYNGGDNYFPFVEELKKKYILIPFCPEVEGGLSVPRSPSEIQKDGSVMNKEGKDVTSSFVSGAEKAYQATRFFGVSIAILKNGSPSCGPRQVYDGSFKGNLVDGLGITARRLIAAGVKVYSDTDNLEFLLGETEEQKEERKRRNIEKEMAKKEGRPFDKEKKTFKKRKEGSFSPDGTYKAKGERQSWKKDGYIEHRKKDSFGLSSYPKKRTGTFKKRDAETGFKKDYEKKGPRNEFGKEFKKGFHKGGLKKPFKKGEQEGSSEKKRYAKKPGFKKDFHKGGFKKGNFKKGGFKKPYAKKKEFER